MPTLLQHAPMDVTPAAYPSASPIERRLSMYRVEVQPRVRATARAHPWIADLAGSFPALLFALAFPGEGADADAAARLVVAGAPLSAAAAAAGAPLWLRAFPPEAFAAPLPALPDGLDLRRRIANHFPSDWRNAPRWLENVGLAAKHGDEDIAVWFAREGPLKQRKKPRYARKRPREYRRLVVLWAWFSRRNTQKASRFIATLWRAELQWKAAVDAAYAWQNALTLDLYLGAGAADTWREDAVVDGFAFIALRTARDIEAEASAMQHCVRTYGSSIAGNDYRLWSVRRDGERVATLALNAGHGPFPNIAEISGRANAAVPNEIWLAARRWLHAQDALPVDAERLAYKEAKFDAGVWRALWRPYWLAKQRIPAWLPLRPDETAFYDL